MLDERLAMAPRNKSHHVRWCQQRLQMCHSSLSSTETTEVQQWSRETILRRVYSFKMHLLHTHAEPFLCFVRLVYQ